MFPIKDSVQTRSLPVITSLIVWLNIVIFALQMFIPSGQYESMIESFALIPAEFIAFFGLAEIRTIFSSMFIHAGLAHLAGNMWFLYIFGKSVEDRVGHFAYLLLYLFCGTCAALIQVMSSTTSMTPMIGASGAIAGILGAYFVFFPRATVATLLIFGLFARIVELPAAFYLGIWFMLQIVSAIFAISHAGLNQTVQIAFWAHAGGFMAGVLLAALMQAGADHSARQKSEWLLPQNRYRHL